MTTHVHGQFQYDESRARDDLEIRFGRSLSSKRQSLDHGRSHSPADNGKVQVGMDGIEVVLVQDYRDIDLDIMGRLARAASTGASESEIREIIMTGGGRQILEGGLAQQSLEDMRIAFAVRGVSRALTHQLVRTRKAAFKQQSQRDCWYGDMPEFRMPESVWSIPAVRNFWIGTLRRLHTAYNIAINNDVPYEDARYILPEGTTNFILCEYDLRTFIETYAYRGCVMFQDEYVFTIRAMRELLVEAHPYLAEHILVSCEKPQRCTYQGSERVEGSCDLPWAKESLRTYMPKRYLGSTSNHEDHNFQQYAETCKKCRQEAEEGREV